MSPEENKAMFLRFVRELRNGNLSIVGEVCLPDFAFHSPNFPRWPRGHEGAKQLILAGPSMFSESQSTLDEIFAADDKVVVRFTIRGTYIGEVKNGFPKPGELFAMGAVAIYRFLDGKIVDDWGIQVSCPTETDDPWGSGRSGAAATEALVPWMFPRS